MASAEARTRGNAGPAPYFARLQAAHAAAAAGAGETDYTLAVGSWTVRMRFAGDALVDDVVPFFARVSAGRPRRPDITICLSDGASTGVGAPHVKSIVRPRGDVEGYNDERFGMMLGGDRSRGSPSISMFDRVSRTGVFWVPDHRRLPWWDRAAPLRAMMNFAVRGEHHQLVHAAAIGHPRAAALLAAPSGSGKSTTTMGCLQAGLQTAGDDYVAVTLRPHPTAFAVWSTAKADLAALELLPGVGTPPPARTDGAGKFVLDIAERWPGQLAAELPIRALLVPALSRAAQTRAEPLSPGAALMGFAAATALQFPQDAGALARLGELVRKVPCYRLHLSPDPAEAAERVRALLDEAAG